MRVVDFQIKLTTSDISRLHLVVSPEKYTLSVQFSENSNVKIESLPYLLHLSSISFKSQSSKLNGYVL